MDKNDTIPKLVITEKIQELQKEYREKIGTNSIRAFILKCQIEILEELKEEK